MKSYPIRARIRAQGETTRLDVYDDIGGGFLGFGGVSASDVAAQLQGVKGALDVHINSYGGDVFDGLAIREAIRNHMGPVTTVVDGIAASIASVIAQAGATRVMTPGSMMMIHDAWGYPDEPNEEGLLKMAATLGKISDNLAAVYADRAGGSQQQWRAAMQAETWYTADEAVAAGLADKVAGAAAQMPEGLDVGQLAAHAPARIAARLFAAAGGGGDDLPDCKTCDGKGRLKHPGTGKNGMKCPGCGGSGKFDPDGDGDDDSTPEGDTDHDYFPPVTQTSMRLDGQLWDVYRLAVRDAGKVDNSPWDGSKAMSNGADADDPAAFYKGICAGRKEGDPSKQSSWALPYKYHPSDPPNAAGTRNALARLPQTQGLTNESEAKATLEKAMKQVNPDWEPEDRLDIDFSGVGPEILKAVKEAFK